MDPAGRLLYHAAAHFSAAAAAAHFYARAPDTTAAAAAATAAAAAHTTGALASASASASATQPRPGYYKIVGVVLAVCAGLFIGCSFVIKKVGLLKANVKYNQEAGEGYGYLKNAWWWLGMGLMIVGEICNFVAYAFVDAILVTPLGALSVVVTAVLSAVFLNERLSFVGWVACFLCIVGSVVITLNAPEQSAVSNIQEMQHYVIAPGFLAFAAVVVAASVFVALWLAPRYAKKTMLVYLSICSLVGGLSVVATQGLGAAIVAQINGEAQFNHWFLYVLFVFVVGTLLTEIVYLNKALNIYNAALVTPTYYVYFTSATIVTSAILFRGFHGTSVQIIDVVMGFLTICSGVILLQLAKSSKDVPDSEVLSGDLGQIRTVAQVEEKEYEPRADTIRGGAGIVRALSTVRTRREAEEAKRIHQERMEPIGENEAVAWDGLRRRKTASTQGGSVRRTKTIHPPLGMSHVPDPEDVTEPDSDVHPGFFGRIGRNFTQRRTRGHSPVPLDRVEEASKSDAQAHVYALPEDLRRPDAEYADSAYKSPVASASESQHIHWAHAERDRADSQGSSLAPPRPPPHGTGGAKRQFSFQNVTNVFSRNKSDAGSPDGPRPMSRGALSFASRRSSREYPTGNNTTEEERLGLVHGDSHKALPTYPEERESPGRDSDEWQVTSAISSSPKHIGASTADLGAPPGRRRRNDDSYDDDDDDDDDLDDDPVHDARKDGSDGGTTVGKSGGGRAFV